MKLFLKKRLPEANVQAELYMKCREFGYPCILEYRVKGARFDAVIHRGEDIICIVEVKNLSRKAVKRRLSGERQYKQIERYENYGVPVLCLWNMKYLDSVVAEIARLYHE